MGEREIADKVVNYFDTAWDFEIGTLGFSPPIPDEGECGPDEKFDVFLYRGHRMCWVDSIDPAANEGVTCGPVKTYMLLDPWGEYGGDILRQTIGHEFNHASQAVHDWNETIIALEMTASYVEQYFWDAHLRSISDFQANPEGSLLWVDNRMKDDKGNPKDQDDPDNPDDSDRMYYYQYGSALYMRFLRDRYFPDDQRFAARLWKMLPNVGCTKNSPHIVDGLNKLLREARPPSSFLKSATEFARWRYYTGSSDDGRHFRTWPMPFAQLPFILPQSELTPNGAQLAPNGAQLALNGAQLALNGAQLALDGAPLVLTSEGTTSYKVKKAPMILGSSYIEIRPQASDQTGFEVELIPLPRELSDESPDCPPDHDLKWVVQAVPGAKKNEDGEFVNLRGGPARLDFVMNKDVLMRTLIITLLPTGSFDPDNQCKAVFPFELRLGSLKKHDGGHRPSGGDENPRPPAG